VASDVVEVVDVLSEVVVGDQVASDVVEVAHELSEVVVGLHVF